MPGLSDSANPNKFAIHQSDMTPAVFTKMWKMAITTTLSTHHFVAGRSEPRQVLLVYMLGMAYRHFSHELTVTPYDALISISPC